MTGLTTFTLSTRGMKNLAEREGFEPPEGRPSTVFKTAAFNRSATSPKGVEDTDLDRKCNGLQARVHTDFHSDVDPL